MRTIVTTAALVALALGCKRERVADAEPMSQTRLESAELPRAGGTATVRFDSDRDRALVVIGSPDVHEPIVYLHGMCADPKPDLEALAEVARDHGTIIALPGDVPCPGQPGRTKWTDDPSRIDGRVSLAIAAVNGAGIAPFLIDGELIVIGMSMGAVRAESLAAHIPARYSRLVLVSGPKLPSPSALGQAHAVATVAGDLEPQGPMRDGARVLATAGVPSRFFLLPGAPHGDFGTEGPRVMREAVAFVRGR